MTCFIRITTCGIIFFFLSIGLVNSQDQKYRFRHITAKDGLSNPFVRCILKDSRGFIWFGTANGLNRFDGYNLKVYKHIPQDSNLLSANSILSLMELDAEHLLVGTTGGLNRFDKVTERFIHYRHHPADTTRLNQDMVNVIYRDPSGLIWVGTNDGLNLFYPGPGTFEAFRQYSGNKKELHNRVLSLFRDSKGNFWVGTGSGLFWFDRGRRAFSPVAIDPAFGFNLADFEVTCINEDPYGYIWIGTNRGLIKYNNDRHEFIKLQEFFLNRLIEDVEMVAMDNRYFAWVSTHWGLFRYDFQANRFDSIYSIPGEYESISNHATMDLLYDETGLLWIATFDMGVNMLKLTRSPFQQHLILGEPGDEFKYSASDFCEDTGGNIWVATHEAGLLKFDHDLKQVSHYILRFSDNTEFDGGRVKIIMQDAMGTLWAGISNPKPSICIFHEKSGIFQLIPDDTIRKPGKVISGEKYINDMIEDRQGNKWLGFYSGLFLIPARERGDLMIIPVDHPDLSSAFIWDLYEDRDGHVWVASNKGLYSSEPAEKDTFTFTRYACFNDGREDKSVIPRCIYQGAGGEIWIGTSHGLYKMEKGTRRYHPVHSDDELIGDNRINAITEDASGNFWMGTEKGLARFNAGRKNKYEVSLFERADGLPYEGTVPAPLFKSRSGTIFVTSNYGTQNGFYCFHPDSIPVNTRIPNVVITAFTVRNNPFRPDSSISYAKHLYLKHNENYFSFEFTALDYVNPGKNRYAYKLEGIDDDWVIASNRHFANYTAVPPGNYTFLVRGSNNDGFWNEEGTFIRITIAPPPWKTWWAYTVYVLILFSIFYFIIRFYLRRQQLVHKLALEQMQTEKLEELDKMKSRFFANISHEFRTPLTLILGPLEKLRRMISEEARQDLEMMERNARRLQHLIDQLLSLSRLESGQMKLRAAEVDLVKLVNGYVQLFESLARQRGIGLEFHSESPEILAYIDRDKLEKILYNLLSNAFKFTPEGGRILVAAGCPPFGIHNNVTESLTKQHQFTSSPVHQFTYIVVSDTGIGIPADKLKHIFDRFYQADDSASRSHEGTGIGLALVKELAELHHGTVTVESALGKGTTFTITLPLGKEHLKEEEIVGEIGIPDTNQRTENLEYLVSSIQHPASSTRYPVPSNEKPVLLLIEDNSDLRDYIREFLEQSYRVVEANDGEEGLSQAIESVPDLVISDVMMPKMDGFELCAKLKTDVRTSHIPVILLTARASVESRIEGLETGADDFITKPFDALELQTRIKNLIRQRQLLSEVFAGEIKRGAFALLKHISLTGLNEMDRNFIRKAYEVVEKHLSDPEFDVGTFGREMAISRVHLHRKLKALINLTATEFIRTLRLNKAAEMLARKSATISEIAYDVGFSTVPYFTKCFHDQFGMTPTAYAENHSDH